MVPLLEPEFHWLATNNLAPYIENLIILIDHSGYSEFVSTTMFNFYLLSILSDIWKSTF